MYRPLRTPSPPLVRSPAQSNFENAYSDVSVTLVLKLAPGNFLRCLEALFVAWSFSESGYLNGPCLMVGVRTDSTFFFPLPRFPIAGTPHWVDYENPLFCNALTSLAIFLRSEKPVAPPFPL